MSERAYFGINFGPVCDDLPHVDTPVGAPCLYCNTDILAGHDGLIIPYIAAGPTVHWVSVHKECQLREVMGGIAHLERRCSCFGGSDHDDDTMTARESALAVWAWVQKHGTPL